MPLGKQVVHKFTLFQLFYSESICCAGEKFEFSNFRAKCSARQQKWQEAHVLTRDILERFYRKEETQPYIISEETIIDKQRWNSTCSINPRLPFYVSKRSHTLFVCECFDNGNSIATTTMYNLTLENIR